MRADEAAFETKLRGIAAYQSQLQIAKLVDIIRNAGAYEYLCELNFNFHSPDSHKTAFA